MAIVSNPHGLRVVTGGQVGSFDVQYVLIKCYNAPFTLTPTVTFPTNNWEFISDSNDGLSEIIQIVQDFAEIYYIGWPQADSGGETDLTRLVVAINWNTARGLDSDNIVFPTATGRWTALETELNARISVSDAEAWFAMPGGNWSNDGWNYNQ